jgi:hypothetical protein
LLRFNLQPVSLAKPFNEMAVGFYIHTDMNFVVTERQDKAEGSIDEKGFEVQAVALPGAQED